jgi:hypothetical protein
MASTISAGATLYYSGASNKTGTWKIVVIIRNDVAGTIDVSVACGEYMGNGSIGTVPVGCTAYYGTERVV